MNFDSVGLYIAGVERQAHNRACMMTDGLKSLDRASSQSCGENV